MRNIQRVTDHLDLHRGQGVHAGDEVHGNLARRPAGTTQQAFRQVASVDAARAAKHDGPFDDVHQFPMTFVALHTPTAWSGESLNEEEQLIAIKHIT